MPAEALDESAWKELAIFWKRLARVPQIPFDTSLIETVEALKELMSASHVLLVIQLRIHHDGAPAAFQPVASRDFGPDALARLKITQEWAVQEPLLHEDPILRRIIAGAGEARIVMHRADTTDEEWREAPVRRLLQQLRIHDRVNVVVPVADGVEVSFCFDRAIDAPAFDERDRAILDFIIDELRPLATNLVSFHGLMPGQQRLSDEERALVVRLLSPQTEAEIARDLGLDAEAMDKLTKVTFEKLNVTDRVALIHLWRPLSDNKPIAREEEVSEPALDTAALIADPFMSRVRAAIDHTLGDDDFSLEAVASALGMSPRNLQRGLRQRDVSFSSLRDERRLHLAMVLLALPWMTFKEVSERLGFAQVSSFNRAVSRWSGKTPTELQDSLLQEHDHHRELPENTTNDA